MADITPGGILDRVAEEIPNFFRDGVDQVITGEGEYIRSGAPQGIVGKVGQAVARSYCRQYGADPGAAKFGNAARIENACRPYLDDLDPGGGAGIAIPFEGAQCDGVVYQYLARGDRAGFPAFLINSNQKMRGPISGFRTSVNGSRIRGFLTGRSFATAESCSVSAGSLLPLAEREIFNVENRGPYVFTFTITGACTGSVNECGNPPPIVTQPRPIADPTPPPFRFNPDPFVDVDVDVDILPDGTINVNIGGPTVNVDPFSDGGAGGDGGGNDPVGGPGSPGGGGDTGTGGSQEGAADPGEELVGVLVQVLSAPADANRFFNNASVVYRGAYYVAMGYPGRLGLDMSGGTAETIQFFHAQQRGLTDYRVRANVGFNLRVTPYYRILEP